MVTDKQYSWPVYITGLRHAMKCPAVLLVICPDIAEVEKCGEVVKTGHPARATQVLTAIQHTRQSIDERKAMTAIILNLASEAARKIMKEIIMAFPEVKNDFLDGLEREATERRQAKGMAQGMARGIAQGVAQGMARGKAEDILKVLDVRGLATTAAQREQVTACIDPARLSQWFDRALTATAAADVFAD